MDAPEIAITKNQLSKQVFFFHPKIHFDGMNFRRDIGFDL